MLKLILIFTVIPLLELTMLIKLSQYWGLAFTITLVAITGLLGAIFTRKQGTHVIKKINNSLAEGKMPADSLIDGLLILTGGLMLITPGIITDLGGFSCIFPFTRSKIKILTKERFNRFITAGKFQFSPSNNQESKTIDVIKNEDEEKVDIK